MYKLDHSISFSVDINRDVEHKSMDIEIEIETRDVFSLL